MTTDNRGKKVALVKGANKGIGFEMARQCARLGYKALVGVRDEQRGAMLLGHSNPRTTSRYARLVDRACPMVTMEAVLYYARDMPRCLAETADGRICSTLVRLGHTPRSRIAYVAVLVVVLVFLLP